MWASAASELVADRPLSLALVGSAGGRRRQQHGRPPGPDSQVAAGSLCVKVQRFVLVRKEVTHYRGNRGGVRLQREVSSIKKAHECIWNIKL